MSVIMQSFQLLNRKQKVRQMLLIFVMLIGGMLELLSVTVIYPLVQVLMDQGDIENNSMYQVLSKVFPIDTRIELVTIIIVCIIIIFIVKNVFLLFQTWYVGKNAFEIQFSFTKLLMKKYMGASYPFFVYHNTSEAQVNMTSNATAFGLVFQCLMQLAAEIIVSIVLAGFIVISNPTLAGLVLMVLCVGVGSYSFFSRKMLQKLGMRIQKNDKKMLQWINQSIGGIKEIIILRRSSYFYDKVRDLSGELEKDYTKKLFMVQSPHYFTEMLCITSLMCSILVEIKMGMDINILIAQLATFTVAAFRLLPSIGKINGLLGNLHFHVAVVDVLLTAIHELDKDVEIKAKSCKSENFVFSKSLKVRDLSFSYIKGEKIIENVNLQIQRGKSIAFIGPSGAGKTTLADLILGVIRPDQGDILIDGVTSIYDNVKEWQKNIGYIPQTIFLSDDTIRNNVAFGIPEGQIDDSKVWYALEQAQLSDYVKKLPGSLGTMVGERGVRLSGGQRQRIGIARALYNDPEILVMDEATSALDGETEQEVMEAIKDLQGIKTLIIIAHRLTTIENCNAIYEVKDNKVQDVTGNFRTRISQSR